MLTAAKQFRFEEFCLIDDLKETNYKIAIL